MRSWLKECRVRTMSATEAAWLAGFIDGEGCLCQFMANQQKYVAWILIVSNTDRGSLEYCQQITGVGGVYTKSTSGNRKAQYTWTVSAQRDMVAILEQVILYLQIKREVAEAFLATWNDLECQGG